MTPMFRSGGNDFYIGELTRALSGEYLIPQRYYKRRVGASLELWAMAKSVTIHEVLHTWLSHIDELITALESFSSIGGSNSCSDFNIQVHLPSIAGDTERCPSF